MTPSHSINRRRFLELAACGAAAVNLGVVRSVKGQPRETNASAAVAPKSVRVSEFRSLKQINAGVLNIGYQELADQGNTVIIIEHNLDVISQADWIIDIGPGGGNDGGTVVFEGVVAGILKAPRSKTGLYLKRYLEGDRSAA